MWCPRRLAIAVHIDHHRTTARTDHHLARRVTHPERRASAMGGQADRQDQEQGQVSVHISDHRRNIGRSINRLQPAKLPQFVPAQHKRKRPA